MNKILYIVKYNDCYGNGKDTSYEIIVESEEDFKVWLKHHNEVREANGDGHEGEEEFDLIELGLFDATNPDLSF